MQAANNIHFLIVDLFCGAGGTTTGFENAMVDGEKVGLVIAAVNHDANAIESHAANHPDTLHFFEDIRTLKMEPLEQHVADMQTKYPDALLVLHASLECTNFSKAKGGQPRDADSRTLADHLDRYIKAIEPDYVTIENVVEFMSWGPLDEKGKPLSRKAGIDYMRWRNRIKSYGYYDDWRELNSANYGAYTSRNRLFGIFAKHDLPIAWPEPTHFKKTSVVGSPFTELAGERGQWKPVREVLDLNDKGESIFTRKKALSEKTMERIYAGLIKFVAGGKASHDAYIVKYNSSNKNGKVSPGHGLHETAPVVTTQNRLYLAQPVFIQQRHDNGNPNSKIISVEQPARTLTSTGGNQELVQAQFIDVVYGNGFPASIDDPAKTLRTKDGQNLVSPQFIMRDFSGGGQTNNIDNPAGAVMPSPKMNLVSSEFITSTNFEGVQKSVDEVSTTITADRHYHYLVNPQYVSNGGDINKPCFTLIARMDKAPPYLVEVEGGMLAIEFYATDSAFTIKIKEFMVAYGIVDIRMRMLRILELLAIQGFPAGYKLKGNQSEQKKYIGNSVVPIVAQRWLESLGTKIIKHKSIAA